MEVKTLSFLNIGHPIIAFQEDGAFTTKRFVIIVIVVDFLIVIEMVMAPTGYASDGCVTFGVVVHAPIPNGRMSDPFLVDHGLTIQSPMASRGFRIASPEKPFSNMVVGFNLLESMFNLVNASHKKDVNRTPIVYQNLLSHIIGD